MSEWVREHQGLIWTLGSASIAMVIASLLVIPALIIRIPPDYFTYKIRPPNAWANRHPVIRVAIVGGKNLLGGILALAGIIMFALPGQGLLTLLVGVFLLDFPGKYKFEKWLITRPRILNTINWLRKRRGRQPLKVH
jgi:hypothetical protein